MNKNNNTKISIICNIVTIILSIIFVIIDVINKDYILIGLWIVVAISTLFTLIRRLKDLKK